MEVTEVEVLPLEKVIETRLIQSNVTEQVLAALKNKYGGMKLKALDDKESYLELKAASKDCAKVRTLTVKLCKEGREEAVKVQKLWIAKEKEIVGRVAEVEDALDAEIAKFDAEVERKANEEKQRQEDAYIERQATLTKMGATYEGGNFVLGDASFEAILIKSSSQDIWEDAIVPKFKSEYEKIQAVRIEEENKKAEAAAQLKREQEELARQQEEFRQQQADMQKQKDEFERAEREKREAEERKIQKERSDLQSARLQELLPFNPSGAYVDMATLWSLSDSEYKSILEKSKETHERVQQERVVALQEEAARKERERIAEEQRVAAEKKRREEAKKAEELEQASDKVKYSDLISKLSAIQIPEMRSGQYRKKTAIIREKLEEILAL